MDRTHSNSISPELAAFLQEDEQEIARALSSPVSPEMQASFGEITRPLIGQIAEVEKIPVHGLTLGLAGEIPTELRGEAARAVLAGRAPEILHREGVGEISQIEVTKIPPVLFHLIMSVSPLTAIGDPDMASRIGELIKFFSDEITKKGIARKYQGAKFDKLDFDTSVIKTSRSSSKYTALGYLKDPKAVAAGYLDAVYAPPEARTDIATVSAAASLAGKIESDASLDPDAKHIYVFASAARDKELRHGVLQYQPPWWVQTLDYYRKMSDSLLYSLPDRKFIDFKKAQGPNARA